MILFWKSRVKKCKSFRQIFGFIHSLNREVKGTGLDFITIFCQLLSVVKNPHPPGGMGKKKSPNLE
jgi:hypothetical protein